MNRRHPVWNPNPILTRFSVMGAGLCLPPALPWSCRSQRYCCLCPIAALKFHSRKFASTPGLLRRRRLSRGANLILSKQC
ncbi:hypothetical protein BDA96_10G063400 [Sorghum bicolor]|uniref:Uncharacterized protein n=1 Tax=Sorghum bicolor TaxID=4558 RepID=A0A921Q227_SORBI|nr:hypothetical protein BDA96_10G063400 [Sorghum bicolor]KAG0513001.1 hypothetical protein BDA96_10G063400 [Sorghum bicolor]KAG0513002.1 hypothetical protein BDA96_10G063400 [Sorghum bicolor]KAG0513003.1 hypothetical protein BDA96_10G063400 [Sorghum bicolor]